MPPLNGDERRILEGWPEFYRRTLAVKCAGLDDTQLRIASAPSSTSTLLGLIQHAAEVERNWVGRVLTGEQTPPLFGSRANPEGHDGGFEVSDQSSYRSALSIWQDEISHARAGCASRPLNDTRRPSWGSASACAGSTSHDYRVRPSLRSGRLIGKRTDGATGV
jgi:hypothetical protein